MTGPPRVVVPRSVVFLCVVGLVSLATVALGSFFGHTNPVIVGLTSFVIVGHVGLVTACRFCRRAVVVCLVVVCGLIDLNIGLALVGLDHFTTVVVGLVFLGLVAGLGFFLALALGLVRIMGDARKVNEVGQSGPALPLPRSLAWVRGLLPPAEGAAWWCELMSTLAETPDLAQRRAYVRSYRRRLLPLIWTSWAIHLSSARQRKVS